MNQTKRFRFSGRNSPARIAFRLAGWIILASVPLAALDQEEPLQITGLRLSNHLGSAFVVSWITSRPTTVNQVCYGLDPARLDSVKTDTCREPTRVHYVQLEWLFPDSTYYYRVRSDSLKFSVSTAGFDSVLTFSQKLAKEYLILYGEVKDQFGYPLERMLVRSYIKDPSRQDSTMWFADLTNSYGQFYYNLVNYRRYGGDLFQYRQNEQWLYLEIIGESAQALRDSVLLTSPSGFVSSQDLGSYRLPGEGRGDLDDNGVINIFDLLAFLPVLRLRYTPPLDDKRAFAADLDHNGKIDIFDLISLLRRIRG